MTRGMRVLWQAPAVAALAWALWNLLDWAVWRAEFRPDLAACQALERHGACWGVVSAKLPQWLFGHYPAELHFRPTIALVLWGLSLALCLWPLLARPPGAHITRRSGPIAGMAATGLALAGVAVLHGSDALGHTAWRTVDSRAWGGLPLTVLLSFGALLLSVPLALLLAHGRLSPHRDRAAAATLVIETLRGAPLVMWLFMGAFLLPAVLPEAWTPGPVGRALLVMTVFSAAYMAEILRGHLSVVAREQNEAAEVLGASRWARWRLVVWPQATRGALPALTGHVIGLIKDTALVMIVSLQDLTGAMSMSLNGDADWRPFFLEAYLFIAAIYAVLCLCVARLGQQLEQRYPAHRHLG